MGRPPLERLEELFHRAADLEPGERAAFLETACAGDGVLRTAVEELLRHDDRLGKTEAFIVSPIERARMDEQPTASSAGYREAPALPRHALAGYEVIEVLGSGGMGVVYKARQLSLGRLVALKMLQAAAPVTAEQLARFRAEADALARLQHSNIVQIYEVGEHEGRPYLVMEYVPGPNLAHDLDGRPQPARSAAELVAVLADAIQAVHDCGIIHRDLKPANILLAQQGLEDTGKARSASGVVRFTPKITDFGLAKRLDSSRGRTHSGAILGTPSYMAPEQAGGRAEALGPATDVYALGAILYELLTGRPPFEGTSPEETIAQVLAEEPISPARLRPGLPRDLVTICLKCLHKEPRRRYARAAAFAEDLRHFLAGEPIRARPVGAPERVWRWCRRRPLVAALTATSTLLAVALVVTIVVYQSLLHAALARKLERTEKLAEDERRQLASLDRTLCGRELEEDDSFAALLWLAEALHLDSGDPDQECKERVGIALILRQCPRLVQLLVCDRQVVGVQLGAAGCWLATLREDGALRVWDVMTGQARVLRSAIPAGAESPPVAISPDGRFVAVPATDGSMCVWDLRTGQPTPLRHGRPVLQATFCDDNRALIAHLVDGTVQVWDWRTGRRILLEGADREAPHYAASSANGQWLFTLSASGVGRVWRSADGKAVAGPLKLSRALTVAALRADGRQLALVDAANALWVWDTDSGRDRRLVPSLGSEGIIRQVQWSPDGRLLLTVGSLSGARVWDAASGTPVTPPLAHAGSLLAAGFAGSDTVVTVGGDGSVRVWELARRREETVGADAQAAAPLPVQAPAARGPIRLADGKTVRVKRPSTSAWLRPPRPDEKVVEDAAFSADGRCVVLAGDDHAVMVWDSVTGRPLTRALRHRGIVFYAAFSPDGHYLATASDDRTAHVWDVATGELIACSLKSSRDLERVAFRAGGEQLVMIGKGGFVSVWNLRRDDRPVAELASLAKVLSGRRIAENGTLVPLEAEQLHSLWASLPTAQSARADAPGR